MDSQIIEQIKNVEKKVKDFIEAQSITVPKVHYNHVLNIGTSIICTKYGIGYPGGSFVQAVVNNDLMKTFGSADAVNRQYIDLYCKMLYNIS